MKLATKKSTAVAVRKTSPLADVGKGSENVTGADLIIPRLTLVHEMSRVTKKQRAEYIKGAKAGMFCLASLQKVYEGEEQGIIVVPVYYAKRYVEWVPRDQGGGIVTSYDTSECLEGLEKTGPATWETAEGNEIVETPEHYFMIVNEETGALERVVMSFTGTKASQSRRWLTLMADQKIRDPESGKSFSAPTFMNAYRMIAVPMSNDQGDFHVPKISLESALIDITGDDVMDNGANIYEEAKKFYEMVSTGRAKAAADTRDDADHDDAAPASTKGKDMPF